MKFAIIDCYTDEPSGLGVPPYLGTYPRYIYGALKLNNQEAFYLTIDDLRKHFQSAREFKRIKNNSTNFKNIKNILEEIDYFIVISGIQTPGKYLAAYPGTVKEVRELLKNQKQRKILTGPAAMVGEGLYGGRKATTDFEGFVVIPDIETKIPELIKDNFIKNINKIPTFEQLKEVSIKGAEIVTQHPDYPEPLIVEIETTKGCSRDQACSFCTEPIKSKFMFRKIDDVINEIEALYKNGIRHFRIGKNADFFAFPPKQMEELFQRIYKVAPDLKTLHIDNVNPMNVTEEKVKLVVKYCTPGNIAAFGVETFDEVVTEANKLNAHPEQTLKAIEIINKYGSERGDNGMPKFLPGINIVFGMIKESKKTHEINMKYLKEILDKGWMLRRINIRQAVIFPGTLLAETGTKYLRKNKKYYWKWRNQIRQEIDFPLLQRLLPVGTILKGIKTEIHDGNITFGRQIGTYPLVIGIKKKLELGKVIDVKVTGHMLRSITAEPIEP